jgi:predicted CXXCH cytochrome family protein
MLAVRPRSGAASAFSLRGHELLGWGVLAAAALHVVLLLTSDKPVVEHLKLTAPRYEYAGALALLCLLFLTLPAGATARSRIWRRHRNFQAAHVGAACLLVVGLAVHVIATNRYVRGPAHVMTYVLLSGIVLLALLRARRVRQPAAGAAPPSGRLVFGRHSGLMLAIVTIALVVLLALLRAGSALALREPFVARSAPVVLNFPHDKHRAVACVQCHHNFTDATGSGSCISCHRSARADLHVGAEARFHDFCLGCHRDPPAQLLSHGPVTTCGACHVPQ